MMKKYLKKTSVVYSASSVLKAGVQMLVGLAIARFISPEDYGIWSTLSLLLTYGIILQAGIINGLNLELPLAMGEDNLPKAKNLVSTAQSYIFGCISIVFIAGLFYILLFPHPDKKYFYGIIAVLLMLGFTFYQDFLTATFRTQQSFRKFSFINLVHATVNLITIALIVYFYYYGLVAKSILVIFIYLVFLHIHRPFKVGLNFDRQIFTKLLKVGMPIFALSYIQAAAISFDRVLLIKYTDTASVGIYSFAYLAFSSITMFSGSIASYIYPTMSENFAKNNDSVQLWNYLRKNMVYVFFGLLGIAILGAMVVPYLIEVFFPAYVDSIAVIRILFFAGVLNGSVIGVNVLLSMKKWRLIVIYHTVFSILLVGCPFVAMHISNNKMVGIAYGVLIANLINLISGYFLVYFATVKKRYEVKN